jgi:tetratricopeptide (TPR) repeat protein
MDTDRKIAIAIAGALLVGFTGIAALSILSGPGEPQGSASITPVSRVQQPADAVQFTSRVEPAATQPAFEPGEVPASAGTPEEAAEFQVEAGVNYLHRGIEAYQERNLVHAVAYLQAEVGERPDRPYSHYLLGLSLWKSGDLDEAAVAMNRAAELDDSSIKTFINLSRIENDRGKFDAALQAAWTARDLAPEDATALFVEGRSLHNLGENDKAIEALRHSLEINPHNGYVWNLLGLTFLREGDDVSALDALQLAAADTPDVAYIQNNLGMALEHNDMAGEAVVAYRRAVELDGGHVRATANLARLELFAPVVDPRDVGVAIAQETFDEAGDTPAEQPLASSEAGTEGGI